MILVNLVIAMTVWICMCLNAHDPVQNIISTKLPRLWDSLTKTLPRRKLYCVSTTVCDDINKSPSFYRPPRHTETDSIRSKTPIIILCNREHLYRCAKYPQPPSPLPYQKKIPTHVYINAKIPFIYLEMHNEAQKQAYYPFFKIFKIQTIMDKSPWDSQNVTSILCVSQVLSQKAGLSF